MSHSQIEQSESFQITKPAKAKYTKTSMKKKQLLIEMVVKKNFSIYRASKKLKISNSTAKSIISNYQKYGTILERNNKSIVQKISTNIVKAQSNGVSGLEVKENVVVKEEQAQEYVVRFTQEERLQIIRKMGISAQSYPFFGFANPFFCKYEQT